jgi:hypothetical protein
VKRAVEKLKIDYPFPSDNNYAIWRALNNEYWPPDYFIDSQGRIRHHLEGVDGEGVVTDPRLYQLVRRSGPVMVRTLSIQFLDPNVQAYASTFG